MSQTLSQSDSSHSSISLVWRLKQNDEQAWDQLVEIYAPLVLHWCRRYSMNDEDAGDVVQETMAAVFKSIARFDHSANCTFRGWIWTIARNKIHDHFRKRPSEAWAAGGTSAKIQLDQQPSMIDWVGADEPTTQIESSRLVHRALEQIRHDFQPQTWQAFWRSVVDGHDTLWIAEDLGLSPNSVRQAKSRVLRRLRQQMGDV